MEDNELLLSLFLEGFYHLPKEVKIRAIRDLGRHQGEGALFLLDIMAEASDRDSAMAAIGALGRIRSHKAVKILERISRRSLRPQLVKAARRSMLRLNFLGIRGEEVGTKPWAGEVYKVFLSRIDPCGNRYLWFSRRRVEDEEALENMCLVINEECGIIECTGSFSSDRLDFDATIRRARKEEAIFEVAHDYGLIILKDALMQNERSGYALPPDFILRKKIFTDDDLTPEDYRPRFPGYNLNDIVNDRRLYLKTGELLDLREFSDWNISEEGVYHLADEMMRAKEERARGVIFRRCLNQVVIPLAPTMRERLTLMADLFSRGGQERKARLTLEDSDLLCHPFLRRLTAESLKAATKILSLEMEEEFQELDDL